MFYEGPCESLVVPTVLGQHGILANHSNMISALVPGTLMYRIPGKDMAMAAVSSGLVKIEDGDVLVLVDSAERPEDIDENRAKEQRPGPRRSFCKREAFRSIIRRRHSLRERSAVCRSSSITMMDTGRDPAVIHKQNIGKTTAGLFKVRLLMYNYG